MGNLILTLIILVIVGGAITKIIADKRKGVKCGGCPISSSCSSNHNHHSCDCNSNSGM